VLQIAIGQIVMECHDPNAFNMPHHCYEYHNTLAWFWDNFDHPARLRLLYVAALFGRSVAFCQYGLNEQHPVRVNTPQGAGAMSADKLLSRVESSILALNGQEAIDWTPIAPPWCSGSHWRPARWATIRTTRRSPSAC
jgi:hypothetical protein